MTSAVWFPSNKRLLIVLPQLSVFTCKRAKTGQKDGTNKLDIQLGSPHGSATEVAWDTIGTSATSVTIRGCSCIT